jgi:hypothetical protein
VVKVPRVGAPRHRAGIEASRRSSIATKYGQVSTTKSPAESHTQRSRDFNHGLLDRFFVDRQAVDDRLPADGR